MIAYHRMRRRTDLMEEELGIPVGKDKFIHDQVLRPVRWVNEGTPGESFEVRVDGAWLEAYSIDFDDDGPSHLK